MKINLYTLGKQYGFPAGLQMEFLGQALQKQGHEVKILDILKPRQEANLNIFFPFHYWHNDSFVRIEDGVGGWYTPKFKPFQKGDIPIGFADSSIFDPQTLEVIQKYNYSYFGAMSNDTAKIMNLPRTEIIYACYNPEVLNHTSISANNVPVIYINGTNFPYRRGIDIAFRVLHRLALEGEQFKVILRSLQNYILPDSLKNRTIIKNKPLESFQHYETMASADIMFAPVRGGGFELQIMEALIMGKTVIIPDKGAWTDIPKRKDDVYWIKSGKRDFPIEGTDYTSRAYHSGFMFSIDEDSAYKQLKYALTHIKKVNVAPYKKFYSPEVYANRILKYYEAHQ